jgi:hypothetical protein
MVMICKGLRFVECVKYLKTIPNHFGVKKQIDRSV